MRLQGVPSAQGRLPFLVEHCGVPSSRHHSWLQTSPSEGSGHWTNSSPNICWHCWSRLYWVPGSSPGSGRLLSGASSRQSPVEATQRSVRAVVCGRVGVRHDNSGKICRASCVLTNKMNNLNQTNGKHFRCQSSALDLDGRSAIAHYFPLTILSNDVRSSDRSGDVKNLFFCRRHLLLLAPRR